MIFNYITTFSNQTLKKKMCLALVARKLFYFQSFSLTRGTALVIVFYCIIICVCVFSIYCNNYFTFVNICGVLMYILCAKIKVHILFVIVMRLI